MGGDLRPRNKNKGVAKGGMRVEKGGTQRKVGVTTSSVTHAYSVPVVLEYHGVCVSPPSTLQTHPIAILPQFNPQYRLWKTYLRAARVKAMRVKTVKTRDRTVWCSSMARPLAWIHEYPW